jgi:hypothetical protein
MKTVQECVSKKFAVPYSETCGNCETTCLGLCPPMRDYGPELVTSGLLHSVRTSYGAVVAREAKRGVSSLRRSGGRSKELKCCLALA